MREEESDDDMDMDMLPIGEVDFEAGEQADNLHHQ